MVLFSYICDILFLLCLKDAPWFFAKFILWRFGDFFPLGVLARRAASIAEVWDRNQQKFGREVVENIEVVSFGVG